MNIQRQREARHGYLKIAAVLLPIAFLFGCNSAPTGTAPGLAGGQALTAGHHQLSHGVREATGAHDQHQ